MDLQGPLHFKAKKCGTIFQVACVRGGGLEDQPSVFTLFIKSVTHKGLQFAKSVSCLKRPSDLIRPEFKLLNFCYLVWGGGGLEDDVVHSQTQCRRLFFPHFSLLLFEHDEKNENFVHKLEVSA